MKSCFGCLFLALAMQAVGADTNLYPVLVALDGTPYTNAEVYSATPLYADIGYDGGVARVALTNLPEPLRSQYPYDADKAAKYLADEAQKKSDLHAVALAKVAAENLRLQTLSSNAVWIDISEVDSATRQYTTYINGQPRRIFLTLPPAGLDGALQFLAMKSRADESAYVMATMKGDLGQQTAAIDNARAVRDNFCPRVRAFDTGKTLGRIPVWQCVPVN